MIQEVVSARLTRMASSKELGERFKIISTRDSSKIMCSTGGEDLSTIKESIGALTTKA